MLIVFAFILLSIPAIPTDDWHELPEGLSLAKADGKPVLVYISAPWCGPCHTMEQNVFPDAAPLLHRFIKVKLRFDDHETSLRIGDQQLTPFEWARHLGITATPGFAILDQKGNIIAQYTGYLDTKEFSLLLAYVATGAHKHASFAAYLHNHG